MDELKFLAKNLPRLICDKSVIIPPGDDCAAIELEPNKLQLLAADSVVAGQHFTVDTPMQLAGRKLLARNLSDIAAMGGNAQYALVSTISGTEYNTQQHQDFLDGLLNLANEYGVSIIGGDICGAPSGFHASLTIVGTVDSSKVVKRIGANASDAIFVTGILGDSFNSQHHLNFTPRLAEGEWLAENGFANAMLDISDGLLIDVKRLADINTLQVVINCDSLPLRSSEVSIKSALTDGEDYELLFAVSRERVTDLKQNWPFATKLTEVGTFHDYKEGSPAVIDDQKVDLLTKFELFDHFRGDR